MNFPDKIFQKNKNMTVLKFKESSYEEVKEGVNRKIINTPSLMSVLIDFSNGPWEQAEPYHSHPQEQISYVVSGEIVFYCEGEKEEVLHAGDMFAVPSGKKHTIKLLTTEVRLIDSFTPVREDFLQTQKV
jgi:quercetin dioxygenase-like cupin family protein